MTIGEVAFQNSANLSYIYISDTVRTIGRMSLAGIKDNAVIELDPNNPYFVLRGIYVIGTVEVNNTVAMGWQRRVIRILPGTNWPVLFGDDNRNATGWTTAANLKFLRRGSF